MYTYIHTWIHTYMDTYMHAYIHVYIHEYRHEYTLLRYNIKCIRKDFTSVNYFLLFGMSSIHSISYMANHSLSLYTSTSFNRAFVWNFLTQYFSQKG